MKETQRQKQKNATRKHILDTAMLQFASTGLTKTRTIDIAKAANVSHGTIFTHFPTQEALLAAVLEAFGISINMRLHELAAGKRSLGEVLEAHLAGLMEFEPFYTRLVTESRLLPEEARNTFILIQSTVSFHLGQAMEEAIRTGRMKDILVSMAFNTWIGLIHYYLTNSDLFAPGESVLKRYGQELIEYYICLVTPGSECRLE